MGLLDTAIRDVVKSVIDLLDTDATLKKQTVDAYDPETGEEDVAVPTSTAIKISPPSNFSNREVDGSAVQRQDLKCLTAAKGASFTPEIGDTLIIGSTDYRIINADPIKAGDENAAWKLQLRA